MTQRLAHVTLLVRAYDEAIAFYTNVLGFILTADQNQGDGNSLYAHWNSLSIVNQDLNGKAAN